jgi:hypothetical protein
MLLKKAFLLLDRISAPAVLRLLIGVAIGIQILAFPFFRRVHNSVPLYLAALVVILLVVAVSWGSREFS